MDDAAAMTMSTSSIVHWFFSTEDPLYCSKMGVDTILNLSFRQTKDNIPDAQLKNTPTALKKDATTLYILL
jgi:hypothetical protein